MMPCPTTSKSAEHFCTECGGAARFRARFLRKALASALT